MSDTMVSFSLNGEVVQAPEGMNLIEAAAAAGVTIPHYCYHPGLSVAGNCRMCLCEIEGARGPAIACGQKVVPAEKNGGKMLTVRTDTPAVEKMRRGVQEFLLLNHPIDCPICDQAGECRLQDYYMDYGRYENRSDVAKVQKQKAMDIGPLVVLDQERCILCTRCVRFTDEVSKSHELVVAGRGDHSAIELFPGARLDNPYSGNVVDLCPVGALTSKDFRFKQRVWFMKTTKSVCTGCARGCNVYLDQKDGHVYRYRPREHAEVNRFWLCDAGRLSYKGLNEARVASARLHGKEVSLTEAVASVVGLLTGGRPAGAVRFVGSPMASLEANAALVALARQVGDPSPLLGHAPVPEVAGDDFLRVADGSPNRKGLAFLGFQPEREALLEALRGGQVQVLITLADLAADPELAEALRTVPSVVHLAAHPNATAAVATHLLPAATHAEQHGSFVNVEGRVQRFAKAFDPQGEAAAEHHLLGAIAQGLGGPGMDDVEEAWAWLRQAHPELAGWSWYGLGDEGQCLPSVTPALVGAGA